MIALKIFFISISYFFVPFICITILAKMHAGFILPNILANNTPTIFSLIGIFQWI